MKNLFKRFATARSGSVLIEYVTIASMISVAFLTGAVHLGDTISEDFTIISQIIGGGPPALEGPR